MDHWSHSTVNENHQFTYFIIYYVSSFFPGKNDFEKSNNWQHEKYCLMLILNSDIHCLQHSFSYSNEPTIKTKELFVPTANTSLVGTLISIGDITRNTANIRISGKLVKFSCQHAKGSHALQCDYTNHDHPYKT